MISFVVVAAAAFAAMMAIYFAVKWIEPTWGTIATNVMSAVTFLGLIIEVANTLPWNSIVDTETALAIGFAISVANGLIRLIGTKPAVKMPFAGKLP